MKTASTTQKRTKADVAAALVMAGVFVAAMALRFGCVLLRYLY